MRASERPPACTCRHSSRAACSASPCCALSPGPLPAPPSPPTGARADTHPSLMAFLPPLRLHFCLSVFFSRRSRHLLPLEHHIRGTLIFEASCAGGSLSDLRIDDGPSRHSPKPHGLPAPSTFAFLPVCFFFTQITPSLAPGTSYTRHSHIRGQLRRRLALRLTHR